MKVLITMILLAVATVAFTDLATLKKAPIKCVFSYDDLIQQKRLQKEVYFHENSDTKVKLNIKLVLDVKVVDRNEKVIYKTLFYCRPRIVSSKKETVSVFFTLDLDDDGKTIIPGILESAR